MLPENIYTQNIWKLKLIILKNCDLFNNIVWLNWDEDIDRWELINTLKAIIVHLLVNLLAAKFCTNLINLI